MAVGDRSTSFYATIDAVDEYLKLLTLRSFALFATSAFNSVRAEKLHYAKRNPILGFMHQDQIQKHLAHHRES